MKTANKDPRSEAVKIMKSSEMTEIITSVGKVTIEEARKSRVKATAVIVKLSEEAGSEVKKTKRSSDEVRLAKKWRRAKYSSDRSKYPANVFALSTAWVRDQFAAKLSVEQIEVIIDKIKKARKQA